MKASSRKSKTKEPRPLRTCWLCGKRGRKYYAEHHVYTVEEVPDMTVWLCRGCHWLVNLLSRFKLIREAAKVADLITLARWQANLPNVRTVVRFEEVK